MTKKEKLQLDFEKAQGLNRLFHSPECQKYLVPILSDLSKVRWLDVEKYKDKDTFMFKYQEMKAKAEAYEELKRLLESMEDAEKRIAQQLEEPEKNYAL